MALTASRTAGCHVELELCGEADRPHHAQRIIIEGLHRIKRRAQDPVPSRSARPSSGSSSRPGRRRIQCDCHRIDREVAPQKIVFQRRRNDIRFSRSLRITFLACTDKFQFPADPPGSSQCRIAHTPRRYRCPGPRATSCANAIPSPITRMSMSCTSVPSSRSRTYPPTTYTVVPAVSATRPDAA